MGFGGAAMAPMAVQKIGKLNAAIWEKPLGRPEQLPNSLPTHFSLDRCTPHHKAENRYRNRPSCASCGDRGTFAKIAGILSHARCENHRMDGSPNRWKACAIRIAAPPKSDYCAAGAGVSAKESGAVFWPVLLLSTPTVTVVWAVHVDGRLIVAVADFPSEETEAGGKGGVCDLSIVKSMSVSVVEKLVPVKSIVTLEPAFAFEESSYLTLASVVAGISEMNAPSTQTLTCLKSLL